MSSEIKQFNLFRVNCLLNDSKASNFNSIILSIVFELFYETENNKKSLTQVYSYITDYLKIVIEFDFLQGLLINSNSFDIESVANDHLIKVRPDKFVTIEQTISDNSIDKFIINFLNSTNVSLTFKDPIESQLYGAVFENINSFSVDNLKTLVSKDTGKDFSKEEIDAFNLFLDFADGAKNKAIFNVLSRAVEFAILTSGKGIKEMNIEVFNDKSFVLDTNIIFRLLGVGGNERSDSLKSLLTKCRSLGIQFQYTGKTHIELQNKLEQIVKFLKSPKVQSNIQILGALSESNPELFDDDFIVHYSILLQSGNISTPEQYQRKLLGNYQNLLNDLNAQIASLNHNESAGVQNFGKHLFNKKIQMGVRYGKKASEVDAYNVLVVRKQRGANNYNFSDVKSFYLTSDRSLNVAISQDSTAIIPETILPSQLYILCNPYFDNLQNNDYHEFINFIKKRKTEFKYSGSQVLQYINSIREITTDIRVINDSLILYSNIRHKEVQGSLYELESEVPTYKQVLQKFYDQKLNEGQAASAIVDALENEYKNYISKRFNWSLKIIRAIDGLLTISIIPIAVQVVKMATSNAIAICSGILIGEFLKFYISSRFKLLNKLQLKIFRMLTKQKVKEISLVHSNMYPIIDEYYLSISKNNIWSK